MKSGIYKITISDYYYFGSSSNLQKRKSAHFLDLRKNLHKNSLMQRVFKKYGTFNFCIMEFVPISEMIPREQFLIDSHKHEKFCMNLSGNASASFACPEIRATAALANKRRVWTPEMRAKISASNKGSKWSAESIDGLLSARAKGATIESLAKTYGVNRTTVTKICARHKIYFKPSKWSPSLRAAQAVATAKNPGRYSRESAGIKTLAPLQSVGWLISRFSGWS